ncbi:MarR family winged helix-turn-helix transcriptional regulator [Jannaschia ovalis]|uniref:MarR family transcriptional regulator n=1 Tax=Jannaschia ovalis TaxID=3038773 RepID=A0ABY8L815_9RHOB|nr:MarR family transcriptional regulator [Jannaschia sp. GRR-S6-38]WGH77516.1 MarR family transcriptional regulator [Jannaschia sp. GRR-S6-38]
MNDFTLEDFLPYRLAVAAGRISRDFAREYRERFGLSRAEWRVLAHLARTGTVSVREIAERADMEKSRVSRAAARLEEAGHVAKRVNAGDKRLVDLTLTPSGRAMVDELAPLAIAYQARLMDELGPEAAPLSRALDILTDRD